MSAFRPRSLVNIAKNVQHVARSYASQSSSKTYQIPALIVSACGVLAGGATAAFMYNKPETRFQCLPTVQASAYIPTPEVAERTFIMIKPDGVKRGLIADIIKRFEQRGYKLVAMKMMHPDEPLLNEHYADLKAKAFFPGLIKHITSGPVVAMVWEGKNVVKQGRQMLGETDPLKSKPGSIRGDFSIDMGRNIIHGSDSVDSANAEIELWFSQKELMTYQLPLHSQVFE